MTLQTQDQGNMNLPATRVRNLPRVMVNANYEVDEEFTSSVVDMLDVTDPEFFKDPNAPNATPGISVLTRYSIDRDSLCFKRAERGLKFRDWEKVESVQGVILAMMPYRVKRKYQVYKEDEDNPVLCVSVDMKTGVGTPGINCKACQFSKFPDDDEKERRKNLGIANMGPDCPDRWRIFFKTDDEVVPSFIDLPGSFWRSIDSFKKYIGKRGCQSWQVVTTMQLVKAGDYTNLDFQVDSLIDSRQDDVANAVVGMQACIVKLVEEIGQWHMRMADDWADDEEYRYDVDGNIVYNPKFHPPEAGDEPAEPQHPYESQVARMAREAGHTVIYGDLPKDVDVDKETGEVVDSKPPPADPPPVATAAAEPEEAEEPAKPQPGSKLREMMAARNRARGEDISF